MVWIHLSLRRQACTWHMECTCHCFPSSVATIRAGTGDSLVPVAPRHRVPARLWEERVALLGFLVIANKMVARERMLTEPQTSKTMVPQNITSAEGFGEETVGHGLCATVTMASLLYSSVNLIQSYGPS